MEIKEKIIILGATKYSFMIHDMIESEHKYTILCHTVSKKDVNKYNNICFKNDTKLVPFEELTSCFKYEKIKILNTIGYSNMNRTRQAMSEKCLELGYQLINFISDKAIVSSNKIGVGNIVFPGAYIGTNVTLGDNNVIYAGSVLTHDITIYNNNFIVANSTIGGEVVINNNCFIGMGAVIKNRLEINDYSLIGAGSYVQRNVGFKQVVVPAKSLILDKNSDEIKLIKK